MLMSYEVFSFISGKLGFVVLCDENELMNWISWFCWFDFVLDMCRREIMGISNCVLLIYVLVVFLSGEGESIMKDLIFYMLKGFNIFFSFVVLSFFVFFDGFYFCCFCLLW